MRWEWFPICHRFGQRRNPAQLRPCILRYLTNDPTCLRTTSPHNESSGPSLALLSPPGLSTPSGPCQAGYFCAQGAASPTPEDGLTGASCPPGTFCRECLLGAHSQPALPSLPRLGQTLFLSLCLDTGVVGSQRKRRCHRWSLRAERCFRGRWLKCIGVLVWCELFGVDS